MRPSRVIISRRRSTTVGGNFCWKNKFSERIIRLKNFINLGIKSIVYRTGGLVRSLSSSLLNLFTAITAMPGSIQESNEQELMDVSPALSGDEEMRTDAEDDPNISTLSFLREQRLRRNESDVTFKSLTGGAASRMPNEALVDTMKFLARDNLEILQLSAAKFDLVVMKYFETYPLRKVTVCNIQTKKKDKGTKIRMVCMSKDAKTVESDDSNVHRWLHNCHVDRIRFLNFRFTNSLVRELCAMKSDSLVVLHCIFDYKRKMDEKFPALISDRKLLNLFSDSYAFKNCAGALFRFDKITSPYRPSLSSILSLPLNILVIDFEGYVCQRDDLDHLADWLHDENPTAENVVKLPLASSKNLSLKDFEFESNDFSDFVDILRRKFIYDVTKRPYVLEADYEPEQEWNITLENEMEEQFTVLYNFDMNNVIIQRT
ncbi:hypothetical protein Ddc_08952 [Ditylenchus destructor]|nr:hypothetical protein Ddc_08952 [Ditylenchus destructor]